MAAASFIAATAQTVNVSPLPQRIVWGDKAFDHPTSIVIKGANEADADAVALLRSHYAENKNGICSDAYERYDLDRISDYVFWYAQYKGTSPNFYYKYSIWQYTNKGSVKGINGNVDINICFEQF